jgi:hypothetical protein
LIVLAPSGDRPFPLPAFVLPGGGLVVVAVGAFLAAVALGRVMTASLRRQTSSAPPRGGTDG